MKTHHPLLHPITKLPVYPIGFRRDGRPIWPVFGGDDTNSPAQPAGQPPAPAPAPVQQQPAPQPTPATVWPQQQPSQGTFSPPPPGGAPQQQPAPQQQQQRAAVTPGNAVDPVTGEDLGYPDRTPQTEMSPEQQLAYWKHKARVHETRTKAMADYDDLKQTAEKYQQLVSASQSETERAVAEAHRQGRAAALTEAGSGLVDQWLRAAAHNRMPEESVTALLQNLDRSKFLHQNGGVDTDKVYAFIGSFAPAGAAPAAQQQPPAVNGAPGTGQQPPAQPQPLIAAPTRVPDFGQGQSPVPPRNGLEAGRERARARFAPKTAPAQ